MLQEYAKDNSKNVAVVENFTFSRLLKDWHFGMQLGRGKFGKVYLAQEKPSGRTVAIKVLSVKKDACVEEVLIQFSLRHPNIVKICSWFYDEHMLNIVMELASGSLQDYIEKLRNGRFSNAKVANFICQIAAAVDHCHENNIIHRDVKPSNILIFPNNLVKLCDFGLATTPKWKKRRLICGTLRYMAPELLDHQPYDYAVDIWCVGITLYFLLSGCTPFKILSMKQKISKIRNFQLSFPIYMNSSARDLIRKILRNKSGERLPLKAIPNHIFIKNSLME